MSYETVPNRRSWKNCEGFADGKKKKTNDQPTTYITSSEKLDIITWNINGDLDKLTIIQKEQLVLKSEENIRITPHVLFLQETHRVEFPEAIKQEWHVIYTQYNNTDKGVAILVNKSKCQKFKLYSQEVDSNGRYIVVKCCLVSCQKYTLVCVYNHQSDITTLDLLTPYLQNTVGTLVIGGDFNTTFGTNDRAKERPEGELEHYGPNEINRQHEKIRNCVERFMRNLQLVDVFRGKKGYGLWDETCFTYRQDQDPEETTPLSRLDYFFIPEEWMCSVTRCDVLQRDAINYITPFQNDHRPLLLQLENDLLQLENDLPDIQSLQLNDNPGNPRNNNRVEIVAAIQSLQLRDIPGRPHMTFSPEVIENLTHDLSSIIHSNILPDNFNSAIEKTFRGIQYHFFNRKYLVLSTILAWRLQDWGSRGEEAHDVQATGDEVEWPALQDLIQNKLNGHPCTNDFNIIQMMLSSETPGRIRLYNGCPLSRTLRRLFTI